MEKKIMFKLTLGALMMCAVFICFLLPNYYYYNVAIFNIGFLTFGFGLGSWFYHEFLALEIDDSDIEFMENLKKIVNADDAFKIQITDNDKMRIFKLSDNEIVNHKMGVKS
jgi:hypothetical protein